VVDGIAACTWGPVELHLGRLALATGRAADARRHLARARQAIETQRARVFEPDLDALERRCGDPPLDARRGAPVVPEAANAFCLDGQVWTLTYEGRTVRLGDSKGLRDLARLLAEPGLEHHVLDLAGTPVAAGLVARAAADRADLGEVLDARARASYRRRLDELDDVLAEAEANADLGRVEAARAEREVIAHELAAAVGLGGRPRRAGDPAERARKAVSGRIRLAIGRIGAHHPALARHLTNSVRTGTYCVYRPEHPTAWDR
jgi:hypothetical protein